MDTKSKATKRRPARKGGSRLLADLRQSRPFDRPERAAAVAILLTGDVLHHAVDRALAPHGLSNEQYNALRILRGAGDAGHPTLEISRRLVSRSPNITRLLDKLVDKGLARRVRGTADRRQALVAITPRGLDVLGACDGAVDAVLSKLSCLGPRSLARLVSDLDAIRASAAVPTVRETLSSDSTAT